MQKLSATRQDMDAFVASQVEQFEKTLTGGRVLLSQALVGDLQKISETRNEANQAVASQVSQFERALAGSR